MVRHTKGLRKIRDVSMHECIFPPRTGQAVRHLTHRRILSVIDKLRKKNKSPLREDRRGLCDTLSNRIGFR